MVVPSRNWPVTVNCSLAVATTVLTTTVKVAGDTVIDVSACARFTLDASVGLLPDDTSSASRTPSPSVSGDRGLVT